MGRLMKWLNERVNVCGCLCRGFVVWWFGRHQDWAEVDDEALSEAGGVVQAGNGDNLGNAGDSEVVRKLIALHKRAERRRRYYPRGEETNDMKLPSEVDKRGVPVK